MTPPSLPPIPAAAATEERPIPTFGEEIEKALQPTEKLFGHNFRGVRVAIARALQAARDEERDRACKAVCEGCADGVPLVEQLPGWFLHRYDPAGLSENFAWDDCFALPIRRPPEGGQPT